MNRGKLKYRLISTCILAVAAMGCVSGVKSRGNGAEMYFGIASTIVNITFIGPKGSISRGSGTMIDPRGWIITNNHIIPVKYDSDDPKWSCIVTIPDPESGEAREIYYGDPQVSQELSGKYDLAFIKITGAYVDPETTKKLGEFPKVFKAYNEDRYCNKRGKLVLGEKIRLYGYPGLSGGENLTITEGIVSALKPDEGLIITSAKISHGNSGGLAVDENGCKVGIPFMVTSDENESLGYILSWDIVEQFYKELLALPDAK